MKRALVLSGGGSRGAFQIGVWKYLQQMGWEPDLICGTSIGAINAAAIGSGLDVERLSWLWTHYNRRRVYRFQLLSFLSNALFRRQFVSLMDIAPMRKMLHDIIDFKALKKSRQEIIISAVNLYTAAPEFFNQDEITIDHLLASSAMPILFPWHMIDGMPYWDGGIMANVPLLPAMVREVDEIIVVLLSPVGHAILPSPGPVTEAGEHILEQFLAASYHTTLLGHDLLNCHRDRHSHRHSDSDPGIHSHSDTETENHNDRHIDGDRSLKNRDNDLLPGSSYLRKKQRQYTERGRRNCSFSRSGEPRIITVAPSKMLGFRSLLRFSRKQAETLINEGYENARHHLKPIFL